MKLVRSYNRQSDTTYVYEVIEAHYDPVKGHSVPKRRLVGKIDKETGEMVPTGKKGRPRKTKPSPDLTKLQPGSDESDLQKEYQKLKEQYQSALDTISKKDKCIKNLQKSVASLQAALSNSTTTCAELLSALRTMNGEAVKLTHTLGEE